MKGLVTNSKRRLFHLYHSFWSYVRNQRQKSKYYNKRYSLFSLSQLQGSQELCAGAKTKYPFHINHNNNNSLCPTSIVLMLLGDTEHREMTGLTQGHAGQLGGWNLHRVGRTFCPDGHPSAISKQLFELGQGCPSASRGTERRAARSCSTHPIPRLLRGMRPNPVTPPGLT